MSQSSSMINPELDLIRDYLCECIPFDLLSTEQLSQVAKSINIEYHRKGHVFDAKQQVGGLRIMRSGAAELRSDDGKLIDRFGERVSFNLWGLVKEQSGITVTLIEDSLIYFLPEEAYQRLREEQRDIDRFFNSQRNRRVRRAARREDNPSEMMNAVKYIMSKNVLSVNPQETIQQTAKIMSERGVSSVLVLENDQLKGVVTDRDIRQRAVAKGMSFSSPISNIMTTDPQSISSDKTIFDTTLFMTRKGYHHLPVIDDGEIKGIVTSSDLMLARKDDPIYLVQHIHRQMDCIGMKKIVARLPDLMVQWTSSGIRAEQVASIFTAISDAITARLIELFIRRHGGAPAPFAWLGFGSQGRAEQLLGGDQDNALVIDDCVQEKDLNWFERLAHWVCDGLNICGYVYCPGKVMATTDEWRQPLGVWRETVEKWVRSPSPKAVLHVSIFFDIRVVYGEKALGRQLQAHMLERSSANQLFLSTLAENALETKPPLGIFRQFVVEHDGEHDDELDLKKRGILPIIESVRVHALAAEVREVNTIARLKALADKKVLTINESRNLQDALRIIMQVRLNEQVKQLSSAQDPNNYINPDTLSKLVRKQLRDAFAVITDAQQGVKLRYRSGM